VQTVTHTISVRSELHTHHWRCLVAAFQRISAAQAVGLYSQWQDCHDLEVIIDGVRIGDSIYWPLIHSWLVWLHFTDHWHTQSITVSTSRCLVSASNCNGSQRLKLQFSNSQTGGHLTPTSLVFSSPRKKSENKTKHVMMPVKKGARASYFGIYWFLFLQQMSWRSLQRTHFLRSCGPCVTTAHTKFSVFTSRIPVTDFNTVRLRPYRLAHLPYLNWVSCYDRRSVGQSVRE
jgi:hypothetical protein